MELGEGGKPWTGLCTVVAVDSSSTSYRACGVCERTLSDGACHYCSRNGFNPGSCADRRFFRLLISVATPDRVVAVMCFDRVAQGLFGCPADEFFDFCRVNPDAAETACRMLEGEPFKMALTRPRSGSAQHLRVSSMVPLSSEFRPLMELLKAGRSTPSRMMRTM
ncbi:unnamed protein product [Spirodela intermedia]|uniref:Uncharacterized protein n=1 Tax=Spirodela intermedia TaxID=51605 RepID=A0A7I8JVJ1_SPIIN|nr:unnamed protein product [Spirodela intermedia]